MRKRGTEIKSSPQAQSWQEQGLGVVGVVWV